MKLLVSACLLGVYCRYDGKTKENQDIKELLKDHTLIPVCPEIMGGLPTPRLPVEQQNGRAINKNGENVTAQFERGAREVLRIAKLYECDAAILKERSPSCGHGVIYDGTFTGTLTDGDGYTAKLLTEHGIKVYGETQLDELLK